MMFLPLIIIMLVLYLLTGKGDTYLYDEKPITSICKGCGYTLKDDYIFCPICSEKLKEECVKCGNYIDVKWRQCPFCE